MALCLPKGTNLQRNLNIDSEIEAGYEGTHQFLKSTMSSEMLNIAAMASEAVSEELNVVKKMRRLRLHGCCC